MKTLTFKRNMALALVFAVVSSHAATWNVSSGGWEVPENWNPAGVPDTDTSFLINNAGTSIVSQAGAMANGYSIGYGTSLTGVLHITTGELTVRGSGRIGSDNRGFGHVVQTGGVFLASGVSVNMNLGYNANARGIYDLLGGTLVVSNEFYLGRNAGHGTVNISGEGYLNVRGFLAMGFSTNGRAELNMRDQSSALIRDMSFGRFSSTGEVVLEDDATLRVWGNFHLGRDSGIGEVFIRDNAFLNVSANSPILGSNSGTGTLHVAGGRFRLPATRTLFVGDGGAGFLFLGTATGSGIITNAATGGDMIVRNTAASHGRVSGWGRVGLFNTLVNNGVVEARGHGVERTLDLSSFSGIDNTIENTTTNGWYATDKGRLLLPPIALQANAGSVSYNWGEAAADAEPDLVNSLRLTLKNASAGSLSVALLAPDRTDVPASPVANRPFIGAWSFVGGIADSAAVTIRFDSAAAMAAGLAEEDLICYRWNGARWVPVASVLDASAKTLTTDAFSPLQMIAVGARPPAGTLITIQ